LFDDLDIEKSLLYNPDTSNADIDEASFLDFNLIDPPSSIEYSPTTTTQLFTPGGSEEPCSEHELTPSLSEPSLSQAGFVESPPTHSPLTPTSTLFPPLDIAHKLPSVPAPKSVTSTTSRKRKASTIDRDLASPRPKELVPIVIKEDDDERDIKRKRNTAAARRYRQKKQDRMRELEEELEAMRAERDQWMEKAARQKMETEKYREIFQLLKK